MGRPLWPDLPVYCTCRVLLSSELLPGRYPSCRATSLYQHATRQSESLAAGCLRCRQRHRVPTCAALAGRVSAGKEVGWKAGATSQAVDEALWAVGWGHGSSHDMRHSSAGALLRWINGWCWQCIACSRHGQAAWTFGDVVSNPTMLDTTAGHVHALQSAGHALQAAVHVLQSDLD